MKRFSYYSYEEELIGRIVGISNFVYFSSVIVYTFCLRINTGK